MISIVRVAEKTLQSLFERLLARQKLALVAGILGAGITILASLSWYHRHQVEEARSGEAILKQIAVLTRQINSLTFTSLQERTLTSGAAQEIRAARQELPKSVLAAHIHTYHTLAIAKALSTLDTYIGSAGKQRLLIETGDFDEATQAGFRAVSSQFDVMQYQIQLAIDEEDKWAQRTAQEATTELLAAALLAAAGILILFLRLKQQEHFSQLEEIERSALRASEERFRALTEQSTDIIFIADLAGCIKYASPSVQAALGFPVGSLVGTNMSDLVHPDEFGETSSIGTRPGGQHENPIVELRLRTADGRWRHFECVIRNLTAHTNIEGIVYNARDITEKKYAQEELLFNATHDALTGLPNRAFFFGRLQSAVDRLQRHSDQEAAVLFIDIDDFKLVNDCYGHATGDVLIQEVGHRLRACVRGNGTVARMGGDEFTVLVEEVTHPSDAIRVAERIQSSLTSPFRIGEVEVIKSASIGIALTTRETSAEALLQNADIAMYRAKSQGKACCELFDRTMHEQVMNRLLLEGKLRNALENEELALYYQPIVAVETQALQGFEVLLRWKPPGSDDISPNTFVPVAEQSGLIVPISVWVLKKACLDAVTWQKLHHTDPPLCVSINISSKHFSHASFIGHVKDALEVSAIDPQSITIELTESLAMNDVATTLQTMSQLRDLGVKLSIDDFGTGYSSLSYLRRFPVDTLKIDQSFVKTMDAENYAIVKTIIGLARNLDLKVVAEGVETMDQLQLLALAGCESAQGFLFAKPMPARAVATFVESSRKNAGSTRLKSMARSASKS